MGIKICCSMTQIRKIKLLISVEILLLKAANDNFEMRADKRISRKKFITSESVKYLPVIRVLLKLFYKQTNQPNNQPINK
jgi:hypothetical protein